MPSTMSKGRVRSNLLAMFRKRKPQLAASNVASSTRSLYLVLVFGAFFVLMLLVQMMSVVSLGEGGGYEADFEDSSNSGSKWSNVLGKFLGESKDNFDREASVQTERTSEDIEGTSNKVSSGLNLDRSSALNSSQDTWQAVSGSRDKFFVFSAYFDDRNPKYRYVRVIAATKTRNSEKVVCRLMYNDVEKDNVQSRSYITVKAVNKVIRENWNLKFSAYFVLCLLGTRPVPTHVSVVLKENSSSSSPVPANRLRVHDNKKDIRTVQMSPTFGPLRGLFYGSGSKGSKGPEKDTFAVCVKPLHYDYNQVVRFVEFVELNVLLGVSHFVLYNHTIGHEVDCLLKDYVARGLVSIQPWNLDLASQKDIRTEGLFAALNDCLYRTMYNFKYVLMIDFDEFVVPHEEGLTSLSSLMSKVSSLNNNEARGGAYSFQNAFFYLQWPDDVESNRSKGSNSPKSSSSNFPLVTLLKTTRKQKLHIHKQRSKCIVRPEFVVEMGNHFVWEFVTGRTMVNVAPKFGFLHHYRICEFGGDDCVKAPNVQDRRVSDVWKDGLVRGVGERLELFRGSCVQPGNDSNYVLL